MPQNWNDDKPQRVIIDPRLLTSTPLRVLHAILTVATCGLWIFVWIGVELGARYLKNNY